MNKIHIKTDNTSENSFSKTNIKVDTEFKVPSLFETAGTILDAAGTVLKDLAKTVHTDIEIDSSLQNDHFESAGYSKQVAQSQDVQDAVVVDEEEIAEEIQETMQDHSDSDAL